jgi:hypothetical protein
MFADVTFHAQEASTVRRCSRTFAEVTSGRGQNVARPLIWGRVGWKMRDLRVV